MSQKTPGFLSVQGVARALDHLWPWRNALDAACGLAVGRREAEARAVALCLDCTPQAITEAARENANVILSYLPALTEPLASVTTRTAAGALVLELARRDMALIVGHTAWEAGPEGLLDAVADGFQLRKRLPLLPSAQPMWSRVAVLAHSADVPGVKSLLARAGVEEAQCTFTPLEIGGAAPAADTPLHATSSDTGDGPLAKPLHGEAVRVECVVLDENRKNVLTALAALASAYEYFVDFAALGNTEKQVGLGRVGELPQRTASESVAADIKRLLEVSRLRLPAGEIPSGHKIKRLAISLRGTMADAQQAANYGADAWLVGDVGYEPARLFAEHGGVVFDPGFVPLACLALVSLRDRIERALAPVPVRWLAPPRPALE